MEEERPPRSIGLNGLNRSGQRKKSGPGREHRSRRDGREAIVFWGSSAGITRVWADGFRRSVPYFAGLRWALAQRQVLAALDHFAVPLTSRGVAGPKPFDTPRP